MTFTPIRVFALLITLIYVAVGVLFAVFTPAWQAPDEPAHYNTIRQVAENGCCPIIEPGDWQLEYQSQLINARFAPELLDRFDTIQYEDHQPPLYYLLSSVVFRIFNGSLIALRIFSVLIGAGAVLCMYAVAVRLFPDRLGVVIGATLLFAFIPQHMAMLSAVNNDGLSELLIVLTLLATLIYLTSEQDTQPREWLLGLLVGAIFVTKSTGYFMAAVIPLAILWRWRQSQGNVRVLIVRWVLFLLPALVIGLVWWLRNISVYGFPDFLGLRAHDLVVADQTRTADFITQFGQSAYINRAITETFNSFWGQFGWMALPLQNWMYLAFQALLLVAVVGVLIDRVVLRSPVNWRGVWLIMVLMMVFAALAYGYYNTVFLQHQGRYLFPGLVPFVLTIALGVDAWRRWLFPNFKPANWLTVAPFALLIPLDIYLLWWVIRPLLAP